MYPRFEEDIEKMNERYQLAPIIGLLLMCDRLPKFKDILDKEFNELEDIENELEKRLNIEQTQDMNEVVMMLKVSMADLLADIIVYCTSEAKRWQLPIAQVGELVMLSNESKLGADGKPIINQKNGKFEKGPNYWKPEPAIEHLLRYGGKGIVVNRGSDGIPRVTLEVPEVQPADNMQQFGTKGEEH